MARTTVPESERDEIRAMLDQAVTGKGWEAVPAPETIGARRRAEKRAEVSAKFRPIVEQVRDFKEWVQYPAGSEAKAKALVKVVKEAAYGMQVGLRTDIGQVATDNGRQVWVAQFKVAKFRQRKADKPTESPQLAAVKGK